MLKNAIDIERKVERQVSRLESSEMKARETIYPRSGNYKAQIPAGEQLANNQMDMVVRKRAVSIEEMPENLAEDSDRDEENGLVDETADDPAKGVQHDAAKEMPEYPAREIREDPDDFTGLDEFEELDINVWTDTDWRANEAEQTDLDTFEKQDVEENGFEMQDTAARHGLVWVGRVVRCEFNPIKI